MYFVAVVAPERVNNQVLKFKTWMKDRFNCVVALRSPAHITLVPPFWMDSGKEKEMQDALAKFSTGREDLPITINDFSHFGHRVIFIKVAENMQLNSIRDEITGFLLEAGKFPIEKEERPFHPHVTIANRDLHKKDFQEAWEHFKTKNYSAEWTAESISLLKHNGKTWDVITTARFGPLTF